MEWTEQDGVKALDKMYTRASCRSFKETEIPPDILQRVIKTGLCAASGGNLQPVSIIIIKRKEDKIKLYEACGKQKFIEDAPVNLLFLLDWHKMSIYAADQNAPFACEKSFMHFTIGFEDVICAAQSIETAAHLMGIGSCYVGTTNYCADKLKEMYNLPKLTFPVVMLSLGYPAADPQVMKKLDRDIMVFEDKYPDLSNDYICNKYNEKYGDSRMHLPTTEPYRSEMLKKFEDALLTSFSTEKAADILKEADISGIINEIQRRFGLHYHARGIQALGKHIMEMYAEQGFSCFEK